MKDFKIGKIKIGNKQKPFVVAELSANHGNSIKNCLKLVRLAKKAGANAIKLQTYKPDTITLNSNRKDFILKKASPWKKFKNLWKLYSNSFTPWDWHKRIFDEAKKNNLEYFSSPFDESSVDFLNKLNVKAFKIASAEINHIPMIEKIIKIRKPIIFSLGFASKKNVNDIIKLIDKYNFKKVIFLNCIANYPALAKDYSFEDIDKLKKKYLIGLSDHTIGNNLATISIAKGACLFEKHICEENKSTVDNFFSSNYEQFKEYAKTINLNYKIIKNRNSNLKKNKNTKNKRSIYVVKNIKIGQNFDENNIKIIRPGNSLDPSSYKNIIGKKTLVNLKVGDRIKLKYVK